MAVPTTRSLAELKSECRKFNLTVKPSGKREGKAEYVEALQAYYLSQEYAGKVPASLQFMLNLDTPMLCAQFKELKPEAQESIWEDRNWVAEEKMDGVRMLSFWAPNAVPDFFSRNISVKNFLPVNYRENIFTDNLDLTKIQDTFVLDNEIISTNPNVNTLLNRKKGVVTETMLQAVTALLALNSEESIEIQKAESPLAFMSFDCLSWNGKSLMDEPYYIRRQYLLKAVEQLKSAGLNVNLPKITRTNKKTFAMAIIEEGGEGVILKDIRARYFPQASRSHRCWIKFKRTLAMTSQMRGLGDHIDGWISGFEEAKEDKGLAGLVGSLNISVYLQDESGNLKEHVIGRVANIPLEERRMMTEIGMDGKPTLKKEYYGRVVEIDAQDISARALRGTHCRLVGWRPDRSSDTCIVTESFIKSLVL
jgi:ATP-dependent DNA ligase